MELTVLSIEDIGSVRVLRLGSASDLPEHPAGHYAILQFGQHPPRPYSIANAANGNYLEFHIRNSGFSGGITFATTTLAVGDIVILHGIEGNYAYRADCAHPLLLIAGGTGVSGLLAIAESSLLHAPERDILLFHGVRQMKDLYLDDHLKDIALKNPNFSYIPVLSGERQDGIEYGDVGDIALAAVAAPYRLYIAGPVDMLRSVTDKALRKGFAPDVIHSDLADLDTSK